MHIHKQSIHLVLGSSILNVGKVISRLTCFLNILDIKIIDCIPNQKPMAEEVLGLGGGKVTTDV